MSAFHPLQTLATASEARRSLSLTSRLNRLGRHKPETGGVHGRKEEPVRLDFERSAKRHRHRRHHLPQTRSDWRQRIDEGSQGIAETEIVSLVGPGKFRE